MTASSVENLLEAFAEELKQPQVDWSDTIAQIHVLAICLERIEPGYWWDSEVSNLRLRHLNVINWMEYYGFRCMADLPGGALLTFEASLRARLTALERGLINVS